MQSEATPIYERTFHRKLKVLVGSSTVDGIIIATLTQIWADCPSATRTQISMLMYGRRKTNKKSPTLNFGGRVGSMVHFAILRCHIYGLGVAIILPSTVRNLASVGTLNLKSGTWLSFACAVLVDGAATQTLLGKLSLSLVTCMHTESPPRLTHAAKQQKTRHAKNVGKRSPQIVPK